MTSALYCGLFGMIVAVGLSNLQYVDMNSPRNQFIVGFAIFNSMSVAGPGGWLTNSATNPFGDTNGAEIARAIFQTPMIVAFLCAVFLDNTCPGTPEERGLSFWSDVDVSLNLFWGVRRKICVVSQVTNIFSSRFIGNQGQY